MYLEYLHVSPHLCNEYDQWQLLDPKVLDSGGGHTAKVPVDHVEEPLLVGGVGQVPAPDSDILHQQR